jgi:hypothetical protein
MLRHIISISLAMTACATLLPTKANAATLSLLPIGSLQRNPGDSIEFILTLNPAPTSGNGLEILNIDLPDYDGNELSLDPMRGWTVPNGVLLTNTTTIASFVFNVLQPVRDGNSDVVAAVLYYNNGQDTYSTTISGPPLDVQPTPEPLTMFGAAAALGYGAILKRKYSKKTEA